MRLKYPFGGQQPQISCSIAILTFSSDSRFLRSSSVSMCIAANGFSSAFLFRSASSSSSLFRSASACAMAANSSSEGPSSTGKRFALFSAYQERKESMWTLFMMRCICCLGERRSLFSLLPCALLGISPVRSDVRERWRAPDASQIRG